MAREDPISAFYPQLNGMHYSLAQNARLLPSFRWKGTEVQVLAEGKYTATFSRQEWAWCRQTVSEACHEL